MVTLGWIPPGMPGYQADLGKDIEESDVPADLKEKTYPPQRLEAERLAVTGPPSNPFTRVLDALVPGIDNPAAPPAR